MPTSRTPSPWRLGDAGRTVFGPPNGTPSPKTVAHVASTRADARLIAAAPELLETLQHFREWWANHFEDFDTEANQQLLSLDNDASAVIAKAEGR